MANDPKPAPGTPFLKENGKWIYYIYPDGSPKEVGEFSTEDAAQQSSITMRRLWEANGYSYQGNIAVLN